MPRTTDPVLLRRLLNADRPWAVYALGDLEPQRFPHGEWFHRNAAVVLFYRAFTTPVLFALGPSAEIAALLDEADLPPEASLHVKPEILPLLEKRYRRVHSGPVLRMRFEHPALANDDGARPLSQSDLPALERLYAGGAAAGEAPDFFFPSMVEDGSFFGVWEHNELVAAAGTHLVAPGEQVAAIGNVYTRHDRRGRGFGAAVTSAVVRRLIRRGITTICLSVRSGNEAAIKVYERIGFVRHCGFLEGGAASVIS